MFRNVQRSSVPKSFAEGLPNVGSEKRAADTAASRYDGAVTVDASNVQPQPETMRALGRPKSSRHGLPSLKQVLGVGLTLGMARAVHGAPVGARAEEAPASTNEARFTPLTYMVYNGGPLIQNVRVSTVYWNDNVTFKDELDAFYGDVTKSPWFDIGKQYGTAGKPIGQGSFNQRITLAKDSAFVDDTDILGVIGTLVSAGQVSRNADGNALLSFHFPPNTFITQKTLLSCRDFLGYHGTAEVDGVLYPYSVVPDMGGLCEKEALVFAPNGTTYDQLNRTTTAASHELMEAVTDPAAGIVIRSNSTQVDGPPLGWIDVVSEGEVADICTGQTTTAGRWAVQKIWSNADQACVASPGSVNGTTA